MAIVENIIFGDITPWGTCFHILLGLFDPDPEDGGDMLL
jgi:hypothetical protein